MTIPVMVLHDEAAAVDVCTLERERNAARRARDGAEVARDQAEDARDEAERDGASAQLHLDILHERLEFLEEQVMSTRAYLAALLTATNAGPVS